MEKTDWVTSALLASCSSSNTSNNNSCKRNSEWQPLEHMSSGKSFCCSPFLPLLCGASSFRKCAGAMNMFLINFIYICKSYNVLANGKRVLPSNLNWFAIQQHLIYTSSYIIIWRPFPSPISSCCVFLPQHLDNFRLKFPLKRRFSLCEYIHPITGSAMCVCVCVSQHLIRSFPAEWHFLYCHQQLSLQSATETLNSNLATFSDLFILINCHCHLGCCCYCCCSCYCYCCFCYCCCLHRK